MINNLLIRLAAMTMQKLLVLSGVVGLIYYFSFYNDGAAIQAQLTQIEAQVQEQETKSAEANRATKEFEGIIASVGALSDQFKAVSQQIPSEIQMSEFIRSVDSVSRAAGVATRLKEPGAPKNFDYYESIPLKIAVDGSFSEITMFLYYIASMERLMKVKNFVIRPANENASGSLAALKNQGGKLLFEGQIVSYRFLGETSDKGPKK